MIESIVRTNAESIFAETVKLFTRTQPTHRCLHIKGSQIMGAYDRWDDSCLGWLSSISVEHPVDVFICHDHDFFVLGRALTTRMLDRLRLMINQELGTIIPSDAMTLSEIYIDSARLVRIATVKNSVREQIVQAERQKTAVPVSDSAGGLAPDLGKVFPDTPQVRAQIAQRRRERSDPTVLVIEDDLFSQKLVNAVLRQDYGVSLSDSGQSGLFSYITQAPDVTFLDIDLPDANGHSVLRHIQSLDPDAFVVMLSGHGSKDNVIKSRECGAQGFIGKPFTLDKLKHYIDQSPFIRDKMARRNKKLADAALDQPSVSLSDPSAPPRTGEPA